MNKDEWVHVLCATWMPEVFIPVAGFYDLSQISQRRYRMKCSLCKIYKGAVVQCSYGRCCTAAHPWCAVQKELGFTSRVVPNPFDNDTLLWEVFCKTHCNAVSEPVKQKVKAKQTSSVPVDEAYEEEYAASSSTVKKSSKKKENKEKGAFSGRKKKAVTECLCDGLRQ